MYNVYNYYDDNKTVIARVRPNERHEISKETYNKLMKKRTVGGDAGIYTDAPFDIKVIDRNGYEVAFVRGAKKDYWR